MQPIHQTTHERTVSDQILLFRRRWPVVLLPVVLGALFVYGLGLDRGPTTYEATATLIANPNRSGGSTFGPAQVAVIAESEVVRTRAVEILGGNPSCGASASSDKDVGTVFVRAKGTDRDGCVKTAQAFTDALQAALLADDQSASQQAVDDANATLEQAATELAFVQARLAGDKNNAELIAEVQAATGRYNDATSALSQAEQHAKAVAAPLLRVLTPPTAAVAPGSGLAGLSARSRLLLGAVLGVVLGFSVAAVLEGLDRRIRSIEQVAIAVDAPALAEIPRERALPDDGISGKDSAVMDAYRRLRTVIMLSREAQANGNESPLAYVVLVTSPGPGEGKTTTVAHIAAAVAEHGARVLAIGADLRKPHLHRLLAGPSIGRRGDDDRAPGWSVHHAQIAGVDFLSPSAGTGGGSELLHDLPRLIALARPQYELILIDTPPVLVANDALELVPESDQVILVVRFGQTHEAAARRAAEHVHNVGGEILGCILTDVKSGGPYGYYYGRKYSEYGYRDKAGASAV